MLPYFVSFWLNAWNTDLGLETERHHILSVVVGSDESLASKKVSFSRRIYSAREKLMHISDQARDEVKNCFEGRRLYVPFKTARLHPGSWINRPCQESLPVMIYEEKGRVIWWYFSRIKCGHIVPGWLCILLSVPRTWLIVWFPEVVGGQNSGMTWRSCSTNIVCKHKNASWVFSKSASALDNRFWAQERWILDLF